MGDVNDVCLTFLPMSVRLSLLSEEAAYLSMLTRVLFLAHLRPHEECSSPYTGRTNDRHRTSLGNRLVTTSYREI